MARLSQEKIDEIRQSVDIVDVVGAYLPLEKKGRNYMAICPFHDDTRPSMSVSQDKQIFMCFVCHTGGNVFTFLQDYLRISYIEAVKKVAEIGHVDLSEFHLESQERKIDEKHLVLYNMHEEAQKLYSYYLNTKLGIDAKEYLIKRHFTEDIMKTFQIGYAPTDNVLTQAFEKKNYSKTDMVNSGLVIEGYQYFDRYKDRIIFPLHNQYGQVIGFSGRIYKSSQDESKYLNSPESEIFTKGKTLYNYHLCKEAVKEAGFVYVLEGFMDVIALHKAGIKNTVAIMGTALTSSHIAMLKRLSVNVTLCLDGDRAGQSAMRKITDELIKAGIKVKIVVLPFGKDPDEIYEEQGINGLNVVLSQQKSPLEFIMDYEYEKINGTNYDDRKKYLEIVCTHLEGIKDTVDRDHYITLLSQKSGFSYEVIKEKISGQNKVIQQVPLHQHVKKTSKMLNKYQKAERDLLFYMMKYRDVSKRYEAKVGFMYDDNYRVIASYIVDYYRNHQEFDIAAMVDCIQNGALLHTLLDIYNLPLPIPPQARAIDDYIKCISENAKELKKDQLLEQYNNLLDPVAKAEVLKQIVNLKNEKESL